MSELYLKQRFDILEITLIECDEKIPLLCPYSIYEGAAYFPKGQSLALRDMFICDGAFFPTLQQ